MKVRLICLFFVCLFLGNCIPQTGRMSAFPKEVTDVPQEELPLSEERYTQVITNPHELVQVIDTITTNAEASALNAEFDSAQRLIKITLELLTTSENDGMLDSLVDDYAILHRVARFYVELMPPRYLDSVPLALSSFVTRHQFDAAMMTMDTSELDTSIIPTDCNSSVHYNIPLAYNKRVQKALVVQLATKRSAYTERMLNRALHFRPFMNKMFEEAGLPTDLTFLPIIESAFNPKAYSHAHASGLWQFIPSTGKAYGLRNSYWVDERRDPIKSTQAAIKYLGKLYRDFDDWYLALAAYNCGEGRVGRKLREMEVSTYWELQLPKETMNYVPLFVAQQIIAKNPHCFGFSVDSTTAPFEYDTVFVSDCIDMAKIAKAIGISTKELQGINPHIKQWCTPPDVDNVTLYLPKGSREKYVTFYQKLKPSDKVKWHRYKIVRGDNLNSIANRFGTTVSGIKSINRMKGSVIVAGRYILIPLSSKNVPVAKQKHATKKTSVSAKSYEGMTKTKYKVRSGETLSSIGQMFNVSLSDIISWNPSIKNPSRLSVGMIVTLYVPAAEKVPSSDSFVVEAPAKEQKKVLPKGTQKRYVVQKGDNLYQISRQINVTVADLTFWNKKNTVNPVIFPGDTLVYYTESSAGSAKKSSVQLGASATKQAKVSSLETTNYRIKSGDSFYSIARLFRTTVNKIYALNKMTSKTILYPGQILIIPMNETKRPDSDLVLYRVQKGDNLWVIASRFDVSVREICLASNISQNQNLHPGDTLKIPLKVKE